jgi:nicotinamidase-related amidase
MSDWRMTTQNTALVVIDVQEKLMAAMAHRAEVVTAANKLIRAARILELPTLLTVQYVKGLGPVCAELAEATAGLTPLEKMTFSCGGADAFTRALQAAGRQRIILCGVEAHVCVQQTALDLLAGGHTVYLAADAVCSRRDTDCAAALARLRDQGAVVTTAEAAVYEWLREAGTPQFKQVLPLFK